MGVGMGIGSVSGCGNGLLGGPGDGVRSVRWTWGWCKEC